jgi:hypothetical protein
MINKNRKFAPAKMKHGYHLKKGDFLSEEWGVLHNFGYTKILVENCKKKLILRFFKYFR